MKKEIIEIIALLILAIVAGCKKDNPDSSSKFNISATIESAGTKATLVYGGAAAENFLKWENGDKILLVNDNSRIEAPLVSGADTKSGTFSTSSIPEGDYYAIYPASENNYLGEYDTLFVYYPNQLTYNAETGNVENGGNIMIAKQSGTSISFKNFCSYLRITIKGDTTQKVSKVELEPSTDDYIAGYVSYIFDDDDFGFADDKQCYSSIDINFPEGGVALSDTGLSFNVAVAPIGDGFKAKIYLTNGDSQELTSKETYLERNQLNVMPAFTFTAD